MTTTRTERGVDAPPTPWRTRPLAAAIVGATLLSRLPGLVATRSFNSDEATLAVGGRVIADGGSLYVDFIDRKPPLPFAAYAAVEKVTGSNDLRPVRFVLLVLIALAGLVVADEAGRRWGTRAAWVAGLVLVLGAAGLAPRDAQAANFELFAVLPIAVAVVAAARGRAAVAGAALAVAVLCKQPAAATAIPVAWSLWRAGGRRSLVVGTLSGAAVGVALAWPFGVSRVVHWALLGTGGYLSVAPADLGVAALRLLAAAALAAGFWGGAWLLVAAPGADPVDRADLDLWLLLGASVLAIAAGFRFFPHYLLQLLPAVALLAGRGAVRRPARIRPAIAWGAAALIVTGSMSWYQAVTPAPKLQRAVAGYVSRHTRPGDQIFVWGNEPEVYWESGRTPAGGFPHTEFFTGYSGGRRARLTTEADVPDLALYRRLVARLRRERPVLVIDTAAARDRGGEWYPITGYPAITKLLHSRYHRVATVDGAPIYRLRTSGSRP
ncbi:MAG: conserved rane protein of unknown function [Acidimicrobiales bacterium]|nr:conserved rane protein of unknown function [Acidimicrobiales bacterium]